MSFKILNTIGKKYSPEARALFAELGELDCLDLSQEELEARIAGYDILLVGLGLNISEEIIRKGKRLKAVATATTGLDHIDLQAARERGVEIISLRGEREFLDTITGTAELAFGLLLDLARKLPYSFESVKKYHWDREAFRGHNLHGKTLGIAGLGRLGTWMARYGKAFGMKVIAYDPYIEDGLFEKAACEKVDFSALLERSDVISIHTHLNKETENMFGAESFTRMKNTAYLINTSRGKIVDEKDLLEALKKKEIAGYASDVLADELGFEENFSSHPLVEYAKKNENLIIVPHIGGMTYESRKATDIFIAKKILNFFQ